MLPVSYVSRRLGPEPPAAQDQTQRKNEETPSVSSPGNQTETSDRAPAAPAGEEATGGGRKEKRSDMKDGSIFRAEACECCVLLRGTWAAPG